uniref:Uncharacterized protein n=1 Tax=Arundo donax TaxID=35708 RepID=A0A0A9FFM1_ARUDO
MELVRRRLPPRLGGDSRTRGERRRGRGSGPCSAGKQRHTGPTRWRASPHLGRAACGWGRL